MTGTRLKGAYPVSEFLDVLHDEWEHGIPPGLSTGFVNLDPLYKIKKKQWTVVSGIPSSGKSTFVDNLMVSLAKKHEWKFLVCSPENQPVQRHIENLIEIWSGKKYANPENSYAPHTCLTFDGLQEATKFVSKYFYFINPDETQFTMDYILELATEIKTDFQYDGFVLDPYNEMEHKRPKGFTETDYISYLLTRVRRFCRAQDIHFWFVAHPTKQSAAVTDKVMARDDLKKKKLYQRTSLYDISGGAHWYNKCDNGIIVYRNEHMERETTTIVVEKIRFKECGRKGDAEFLFDYTCNRLKPVPF